MGRHSRSTSLSSSEDSFDRRRRHRSSRHRSSHRDGEDRHRHRSRREIEDKDKTSRRDRHEKRHRSHSERHKSKRKHSRHSSSSDDFFSSSSDDEKSKKPDKKKKHTSSDKSKKSGKDLIDKVLESFVAKTAAIPKVKTPLEKNAENSNFPIPTASPQEPPLPSVSEDAALTSVAGGQTVVEPTSQDIINAPKVTPIDIMEAKEAEIQQYEKEKEVEDRLLDEAWQQQLRAERQRLEKEGYLDEMHDEVSSALEEKTATVYTGPPVFSEVTTKAGAVQDAARLFNVVEGDNDSDKEDFTFGADAANTADEEVNEDEEGVAELVAFVGSRTAERESEREALLRAELIRVAAAGAGVQVKTESAKEARSAIDEILDTEGENNVADPSNALVVVSAKPQFAEDENVRADLAKLSAGKETLQMATKADKEKVKHMVYVDHSKIEYESFERDFYIPPREVAVMTEEEVQQLYKDLDGARVTGSNPPKPMKSWRGVGLKEDVMALLQREGFTAPFAVQSLAIPILMSGRNLLVTAKTGSGKTLAYVLPMVRHVANQRRCGKNEGPIGLVLAPTQELASQVFAVAQGFCNVSGLRLAPAYGGVPLQKSINVCVAGCDIMIATPGRLLDLCVKKGVIRFTRCTFVVLDEADRMLDAGFGAHVDAFMRNIRPDRQVALISATLPKEMRTLAKTILGPDPLVLKVGGRPSPSSNVEQSVEFFDQQEFDAEAQVTNTTLVRDTRYSRLLQILGEEFAGAPWANLSFNDKNGHTSRMANNSHADAAKDSALILIFVRDKETADQLYVQLTKDGYSRGDGQGSIVGAIYSGMSALDRQSAIMQFNPQDKPILIATGVAERGVDFLHLDLVLNFDLPDHYESYVHRIGRTGRAGRRGRAISFFVRGLDDPMAEDLVDGLQLSGNTVPEELYQICRVLEQRIRNGEHISKNFNRGFRCARRYAFNSEEERDRMREDLRALGLDEEMSSGSDEESKMRVDDDDAIFLTKEVEINEVEQEGNDGNKVSEAGGYAGADFFASAVPSNAITLYRGGQLTVAGAQHDGISAARRFAENFSEMRAAEGATPSAGDAGSIKKRMFESRYLVNDKTFHARRAVMASQFLHSLEAETHTTIIAKGHYIDPRAKKNNKNINEEELYLLIRGESRESIMRVVEALEKCAKNAKTSIASKQSLMGKKIVF